MCRSNNGRSDKERFGNSTAREFSHQMKMCHSIASRNLATNRVVLTDGTAGQSFHQRKLFHSTAGQDLITKRVVLNVSKDAIQRKNTVLRLESVQGERKREDPLLSAAHILND